jgi:uroporphyrinogen-III synthase
VLIAPQTEHGPDQAARSRPAEPGPLAGFGIGVTAARRADELIALLQRKGAEVLHAPAIRIVPVADDADLLAATRSCVRRPPDIVVATTGIGFRGWVEAADGWGLAEPLLAVLRSTTLLARGPKARGAIRAAGLAEAWSPVSESVAEVLEYLLARDLTGLRVAVQLHGEPLPDLVETLECAGADVVQLPVYRWVPPADEGPLERLVDAVCERALDAVTFTSAPAAASVLACAARTGVEDRLVAAFRSDVLACCVGSITAAPLVRHGIPVSQPARSRLGAMVRQLGVDLPVRAVSLPVAGHALEVRGRAVLVDGRLTPVSPTGMALLRALAVVPGRVVPRAELLAALPGGAADEHAVEVATARLRTALGVPRLVQTVVKRGYRLALDPAAMLRGDECAPDPGRPGTDGDQGAR